MIDIHEVLREQLTQVQYAAATDRANEVLCLACAGSGKSRTLAYRIAWLLDRGVDPRSIVAFTFTKKAAESIKLRVAQALQATDKSSTAVGAMYIGTIHAYCRYLLGAIDARYRQFDVLDENGLTLYLVSRYPKLGIHSLRRAWSSGNSPAPYFATINHVARAWTMANQEMTDFEEISARDLLLGDVLISLRDGMREDNFIDYSLMVRLAVEALQGDPTGPAEGVQHVMVDEYQDVNSVEEALIRELRKRSSTLFVVGDDDQAIYAWRGADVTNILSRPWNKGVLDAPGGKCGDGGSRRLQSREWR